MDKEKKSNLIVLLVNTIICLSVFIVMPIFMDSWGFWFRLVVYSIFTLGIVMCPALLFFKRKATFKSLFVLIVCSTIFFYIMLVVDKVAGLSEFSSDSEKIDRIITLVKQSGAWGKLVYIVLQILQVVFLPLPALVCYLPGVSIWGPGIATILASIGVLIGVIICYFMGRFFGKKTLYWIAGKENTSKYLKIIGKKGKIPFILMQILPFFPDDILCIVAGCCNINFTFFIISMVIIKPILISVYCFLGSGSVIPFSGWGIPIWALIIVIGIVISVVSIKNQDKIEKFISTKFGKKEKSKDEKEEIKSK